MQVRAWLLNHGSHLPPSLLQHPNFHTHFIRPFSWLESHLAPIPKPHNPCLPASHFPPHSPSPSLLETTQLYSAPPCLLLTLHQPGWKSLEIPAPARPSLLAKVLCRDPHLSSPFLCLCPSSLRTAPRAGPCAHFQGLSPLPSVQEPCLNLCFRPLPGLYAETQSSISQQQPGWGFSGSHSPGIPRSSGGQTRSFLQVSGLESLLQCGKPPLTGGSF